ncbi:MAG: hypothetical protein AAF215_15915 [Cyanobacteria bacterium P01_A01_bin.123]
MTPTHYPVNHSGPGLFLKPMLAGGLMFALVGLLFDFQGMRGLLIKPQAIVTGERCENLVQGDATLSREKLAQVLAIPERDSKTKVREIVNEPYCTLPDLTVRSGVVAEREAYPLEFDPQTQLVILYENDEYAGYRFHFE